MVTEGEIVTIDAQKIMERDDLFAQYFAAINMLMHGEKFYDRIRHCYVRDPDKGVTIEIIQKWIPTLDHEWDCSESFSLKEWLVPEQLREQGATGVRLMYVLGEDGDVLKEPYIHPELTQIVINEIGRLSKTEGARITVNNKDVYISDGETWVEPPSGEGLPSGLPALPA